MGKFIDISGQRFGKLVVLKRVGTLSGIPTWLVHCDCGVEKVIRRTELYATKSCGCLHRRVDLVGQRFGKLIVIRWHSTNTTGNSKWECLCDCGNTPIVIGHQLSSGGTQSCGCLRAVSQRKAAAAVRLSYGVSSRNSVVGCYKQKAKKRGLEWGLTEAEVDRLFLGSCFYCGEAPSNCHSKPLNYGDFTYSGIDRLDNERGYISSNVVSCCWECNWMKRNVSKEKFLAHVGKIHQHQNSLPTIVF
jgi:hypothetical protein